jgi:hypothetical protein
VSAEGLGRQCRSAKREHAEVMGYGNDAVLDGIDRTGPSTLFGPSPHGLDDESRRTGRRLARVGRNCAVLPTGVVF